MCVCVRTAAGNIPTPKSTKAVSKLQRKLQRKLGQKFSSKRSSKLSDSKSKISQDTTFLSESNNKGKEGEVGVDTGVGCFLVRLLELQNGQVCFCVSF